MKKYAVKAYYSTYVYKEVEAKSKEDAEDKVQKIINDNYMAYIPELIDNISYDESIINNI